MEFEDIERILELVRQHDLAEFEVESDGMKLRVRKASAAFPMPPALPQLPVAPPTIPQVSATTVTAAPALPATIEDEESVELAVVKSPIVGTFYRSSEPGAAAFVEVGQRVKKDQVLCIIEAMKLMNEITSEYDGEIVSAYVENGKPVQYGERLFAIKTSGF
ncbi:MAG TPA: acetyl-CoA carboxylase biotin carboxyl carrier protein [Vicinamibacterales bacterium]|nr:acetyl-CoA carboxylase biotin carboxyl carrier protein [Vicinamibacterales bacterium]